jgi:hypothetical protein
MRYRYKKYSSIVFRPVIPIEITYKKTSVIYEVLVDSGADYCIFSAQIGEALGINVKSGETKNIFGITGDRDSIFFHKVKLKVENLIYEVEVGFMPNMPNMGYGVIGQIGFFDKFKVTFNYKNKTIFLKK